MALPDIAFRETLLALEPIERLLKCCKCGEVACSPCTLGGCEHIFCSSCCGSHLGGTCPVCDIPAHVRDAEVDRQLFNMVNLCQKLRSAVTGLQTGGEDTNTDDGTDVHSSLSSRPCDQKEANYMADNCHLTPETNHESSPSVAPLKSDSRHKKKVPIDQTTMTQFYNYDTDDSGFELPEEFFRHCQAADSVSEGGKADSTVTVTRGLRARNKNSADNAVHKTGKSGTGQKTVSHKDKSKTVSNDCGKLNKSNTRLRKVNTNNMDENKVNTDDNIDIPTERAKGPGKRKPKAMRKSSEFRTSVSKQHLNSSNFTPSPSVKSSETSKRLQSLATPETGPKSRSRRSAGSPALQTSTPRSRSPRLSGSPALRTGTPRSRLQNSESPGATVTTPRGRNSVLPASPALNKRNAKGETPLQIAAIKNDVDRVSELLSMGASPNVRDNAGWTPLFSNRMDNKSNRMDMELNEHEACNHGYVEVARLLLDNGAMINIPGLDNDSPLHDAISNNRVDCVRLLVSRGASLTVRNIHGWTPVDLARSEVMQAALQTPVLQQTASPEVQPPVDTLEYQQPCLMGTSLSREQKIVLQRCASLLQAKIVEDCTPEVTHVITSCNQDGMCPRTVKYLQAVLAGKWILNMEWVNTCLELGTRVCEEAFEVLGTSTCPNSLAPCKGRTNRKQQLPGLFDGCQFFFHGDFNYPTPDRESLMDVVKIGGGKILTREPKPGHHDKDTLTVPYHASTRGQLANCCIYVIYDTPVQFGPIRTERMRSMPASWLIDCAAKFQLLEPGD